MKIYKLFQLILVIILCLSLWEIKTVQSVQAQSNIYYLETKSSYHSSQGYMTADLVNDFIDRYGDTYDFLVVMPTQTATENELASSFLILNGDNVRGISIYPRQQRHPDLESENIKGAAYITRLNTWDVDVLAKIAVHEISHYWLAYIETIVGKDNVKLSTDAHWNLDVDTSTQLSNGKAISPNNGRGYLSFNDEHRIAIQANVVDASQVVKFHSVEMYLMGLLLPHQTISFSYIHPVSQIMKDGIVFVTGTKEDITVYDIIRSYGERIPTAEESQKDFSVAFLVLTGEDEVITQDIEEKIQAIASETEELWYSATNGLSRLNNVTGEIVMSIPEVDDSISDNDIDQSEPIEESDTYNLQGLEGQLVKLPNDNNPGTTHDATVYLVDNGRRRHFPNEAVFRMYFPSFENVQIIQPNVMGDIPLGRIMLPVPGTWIKILSVPNVYVVQGDGRTIRWISSEEKAREMRGITWNQNIYTFDVTLFSSFNVGDSI